MLRPSLGRTSGHLSSDLDDGYVAIAQKHGDSGAKLATHSHAWALRHVGDVSKQLQIDCEYRMVKAYDISQFERSDPRHNDDLKECETEAKKAHGLGLDVSMHIGGAIKGWDGSIDQRDLIIFDRQATFHPTKYLNGVLRWLKAQSNFQCFIHTRVLGINERGIEILGIANKYVKVSTKDGHTVTCKDAIEATCVPLQKLSVVAQLEYNRTYCIAVRVPKGSVEDCMIYDSADPYKYVRLTNCDPDNDYLVVGGCDHKVGQEGATGRFEELENWIRARFTHAGTVDYRWSGQIFEPVDHVAMIGRNQGKKHTFIVTGDSGNGLTHGVIAGRLLADQIQGIENPWSELYDPTRLGSIAKSIPSMLGHDLQINTQYKRFLHSDINDVEDLAPGSGGVLHPKTKKPVAVYKDDAGRVRKLNALCPHLKGVLCWNGLEKSWDCPVHGSRFSKEGVCIMGPAKDNMEPYDDDSRATQEKTSQG